jgi:hypothetical protein
MMTAQLTDPEEAAGDWPAEQPNQRDQELTDFYDRHSAMGLSRIRQLLNDVFVRRRRADRQQSRSTRSSTTSGRSEASVPVSVTPDLSDEECERLGVLDHSRHVSSLGRR